MKVLLVSQHFWPESFRINEVVESLQDVGCEVAVLTGQPNYPDGKIFPGYCAYTFGCRRHERGYDILRVPLVPRGRANALRLMLNYLSFVLCGLIFGPWLLRGRRFDAILVYAPSPILQVIPAVLLKWIKRAPLVTWVQDLWPQSLEVTGFVRSPWLLASVAVLVRWIYRRNDLLLVQSRAFVDGVKAMAGRVEVRYHPNPGEYSVERPGADAANPVVRLEPGFNVLFAGNLGTVQALDTVVEAADLLRDHAGVRFVLVGSGSRGAWLAEEVERRGLRNLRLPGRVAPEAMSAILAQASALLVSLTRDLAMSQTVPSKIQAYLAAGKPIIASLDGEGARIVREAGAGFVAVAEDPNALAQAILRLQALSSAERSEMGQAGRAYYVRNFHPLALALKLKQTLEGLSEERYSS